MGYGGLWASSHHRSRAGRPSPRLSQSTPPWPSSVLPPPTSRVPNSPNILSRSTLLWERSVPLTPALLASPAPAPHLLRCRGTLSRSHRRLYHRRRRSTPPPPRISHCSPSPTAPRHHPLRGSLGSDLRAKARPPYHPLQNYNSCPSAGVLRCLSNEIAGLQSTSIRSKAPLTFRKSIARAFQSHADTIDTCCRARASDPPHDPTPETNTSRPSTPGKYPPPADTPPSHSPPVGTHVPNPAPSVFAQKNPNPPAAAVAQPHAVGALTTSSLASPALPPTTIPFPHLHLHFVTLELNLAP